MTRVEAAKFFVNFVHMYYVEKKYPYHDRFVDTF